MSIQPYTILIDTCVWLDYYLTDRAGHKEAFNLIDAAFLNNVTLLYAVTTAKDLFFMIDRLVKKQIRDSGDIVSDADAQSIQQLAWACIDHLEENATAVGMDMSDVWLAKKLRSIHSDLEDNLVLAAAERSKADLLVTTDESLLKHSPVLAKTPSQAQELLNILKEK